MSAEEKENKLSQLFANEALPDKACAAPAGRRASNRRVSFAAKVQMHEFDKPPRIIQHTVDEEENGNSSSDGVAEAAMAVDSPDSPFAVQKRRLSSPRPPRTLLSRTTEVDMKEDEESSFSSFNSDDDHRRESVMMEFTGCVGGLIETAAVACTDDGDNEDGDAMDLTRCVGALISADVDKTGVLLDSDDVIINVPKRASARRSEEDDTMEMTMCVGGVLDPSPFLATGGGLMEETPVKRRLSRHGQLALPEDDRHFLLQASPHDTVTMDLTQVIHSAVVAQPSKHSSAESPVAKASLKDFLADCGVRFLDNLSSLTRRETIVPRARDSTLASDPGYPLYVMRALAPELGFYETACTDLAAKVLGQREVISGQEQHFNHSPPVAFYQIGEQRVGVIAGMKTLKSTARLAARLGWYEWRRARQEPMARSLAQTASEMLRECEDCTRAQEAVDDLHVDELRVKLVRQRNSLRSRHEAARGVDAKEARRMETEIAEQSSCLSTLDAELAEMQAAEADLRASIEQVVREKQQLSERMEHLLSLLRAAVPSDELAVEELRGQLSLQTALQAWRLVSVRSDSVVIEYLRGPVTITARLTKKLTSQGGVQAVVSGLLIESSRARPRTLRHADSLIKPTFKSLPKTLLVILGQLDRLALLEHEIEGIGMQCGARVLDELPAGLDGPTSAQAGHPAELFGGGSRRSSVTEASPKGIPIQLSFFSFEARCKFDVVLLAWPAHIRLAAFVPHYGAVTEADVAEAIDEALGVQHSRCFDPLKRIVTALQALMHIHASTAG